MRGRADSSWPRALAGACALAAGLLVAGAPADAGGRRIAVGDYNASPIVSGEGTHSIGVFSVERSKGKRWIVPTESYDGIYYPDSLECGGDSALPLSSGVIQISRGRRFKIAERDPDGNTPTRVVWKGHWSKPGVVSGSITIRRGDCSTRHHWSGGKVG